ncbi:MAG TPA: hypothetical protein VGK02_10015 [Candidatus Aquicultor sp.]|jgi:hypothetical protein
MFYTGAAAPSSNMQLPALAVPQTKRMFNQAFFKKIHIKGKKASSNDFANPFDLIFSSSSNKNFLVALTGRYLNFSELEKLKMYVDELQ